MDSTLTNPQPNRASRRLLRAAIAALACYWLFQLCTDYRGLYSTIPYMIRAGEHYRKKIKFPDGSIIEAVIWKLPEPTQERPHGFKYRLNYSAPDGSTLVRYDNELGKGDHRHSGDEETDYDFQNTDQLLDDFWRDVAEIMEMETT